MSDPNEKPARGRPRTLNRSHVVEVARDAYWQNDPADVSVNTVCRLAAVSKPSLYREFGSEDGLTHAALDDYAEQVLSDVFAILSAGRGLHATLEALKDFACADHRTETGCLFTKMRAVRHRLGPKTRERVDQIEAAAQQGYRDFLQGAREAGEWTGSVSVEAGARYLNAQISLAVTQRAAGENADHVRDTLSLALSVFD